METPETVLSAAGGLEASAHTPMVIFGRILILLQWVGLVTFA
jgi:hypothetical protein